MAVHDPLVTPVVGDTSPALVPTSQLTEKVVNGAGVFDALMQAATAHLDKQFEQNRIRGPEYATVYLSSMQQVLQTALQFLVEQPKIALTQELLRQQVNNAGLEAKVLVAQECKLRAEYDNLLLTKLKTTAETNLLTQKIATEKAQVSVIGVEPESLIGRQTQLYLRQAEGFQRDAEQKAAKLLIDTWNVRRTTDSGTIAGKDPTNPASIDNRLGDNVLAAAVGKLMAGVGVALPA